MAKNHRLTQRETEILVKIAYRESSWENWQITGRCYGLFQHMTLQPKSKWASPFWSTNRAIHYCRDRYGSITNAWRFWQVHLWY